MVHKPDTLNRHITSVRATRMQEMRPTMGSKIARPKRKVMSKTPKNRV